MKIFILIFFLFASFGKPWL